MKVYKKPKIAAIELDQKQAILEVCAVDGLYLGTSGTPPRCGHIAGFIGPNCDITPKGAGGGGTTLAIPPNGGDMEPAEALS
ncbi:MAG: hypothetical protein PHQ52_07715 [Candidatus Omnitrophica bacterium]|nr:hypothetical protein [Candidatus Omnitrophota bacterium]